MTGQSVGGGVRGGGDRHLHLLHPPTSYVTVISSSLTVGAAPPDEGRSFISAVVAAVLWNCVRLITLALQRC